MHMLESLSKGGTKTCMNKMKIHGTILRIRRVSRKCTTAIRTGNASNGLAVAALICSVLSIVSVCCLYGAFVFGGLAIIFALLSRGARKKTYGAAHTALLIGTAGVLISVVITIGSFITVSRQYGGFDKFLERYTYTLEQNFGIDLDPGSDNSSTDNGSDGTSIFDNNGSGDYL